MRRNWGGSLESPFQRVWLQTLGREQLARAVRPPGQGGEGRPKGRRGWGSQETPHLPWSCLFIFRLLTWPFPDGWPSSIPGCGCQHPPCCPMSPRRDTAVHDSSATPTTRGEGLGAGRALGSREGPGEPGYLDASQPFLLGDTSASLCFSCVALSTLSLALSLYTYRFSKSPRNESSGKQRRHTPTHRERQDQKRES